MRQVVSSFVQIEALIVVHGEIYWFDDHEETQVIKVGGCGGLELYLAPRG